MTRATINTELLRQIHLFSSLDKKQLAKIVDSTRIVKIREGARVFELGQQAERFYLVTKGQIKLFRISEEGNEKIIEIVAAGRLFAEAVMFMQHRRYPVSASALQASELYAFDNQTFLDLLHGSIELCFALLGDLSMRLHARLNEIDYLTLQNATFRVVSYLINLLPDADAESAMIDLAAPKQAIASQLSITPETFSRILHTMVKQGIITIHGKTIGVHSTARLREFGRYERALYAYPNAQN